MKPTLHPTTSQAGSAPQPKRRGVLIGAGAAAAGGALAVVASRSGVEDAAASTVQQALVDDASGYRLTDHVRRYYDTART
jgi:hypothetical protein